MKNYKSLTIHIILLLTPINFCLPQIVADTALSYQTGLNQYSMQVDSTEREFFVYVPTGYDSISEIPLIFMFHGTSSDGENIAQNSGWIEKAEKENALAIFPSALAYFIEYKNAEQTKWNRFNLIDLVPDGTDLKDDVRFVQKILERLIATFNVDRKRIFASGYSNGGGFVNTRLLIEMPDVFAAFATGVGFPSQTLQPKENEVGNVFVSVGTRDNKQLGAAEREEPFPTDPAEIMQERYLRTVINRYLQILDLDSLYTANIDTPYFTTLNFTQSLIGANNEFKFLMVNDMGHIYANGTNDDSGLSYPELFWKFFVQHPRTILSSVDAQPQGLQPESVLLYQNYPNPFNPATTILFSLQKPGEVLLTIFDVQGRQVRQILNGPCVAGNHVISWDGRNGAGKLVTSSTYFYQLQTQEFILGRKMILVK
ncbi:MAG: T9SS C-terminal target domain-containing protein [Calditrichaeota bacterium]|nr:MAG: T9SS C-terminal target domain-containing protein [Calditrichota bacterium]